MARKRLFTMEQKAMVTTIAPLLVSLSVLVISVHPQRTNSVLNTGLARISGLVPVVQRSPAQRDVSARSKGVF
jgi:hypothetical protein